MRLTALVAFLSASIFLGLLLLMQFDPDDFYVVDTLATKLVVPFQTLGPAQFFVVVTTIGSTTGVVLLAVLCAVLLRTHREVVLRLALALAGMTLTVETVKHFVGRIRPEALPLIGHLHSFSFPSGHTASVTALVGVLLIVLYQSRALMQTKVIGTIAGLLFVFLVGLSRIVLAAHFASDVLAGLAVGLFWASVVWLIPLSPGRREEAGTY